MDIEIVYNNETVTRYRKIPEVEVSPNDCVIIKHKDSLPHIILPLNAIKRFTIKE